jgi:hypothetical protein
MTPRGRPARLARCFGESSRWPHVHCIPWGARRAGGEATQGGDWRRELSGGEPDTGCPPKPTAHVDPERARPSEPAGEVMGFNVHAAAAVHYPATDNAWSTCAATSLGCADPPATAGGSRRCRVARSMASSSAGSSRRARGPRSPPPAPGAGHPANRQEPARFQPPRHPRRNRRASADLIQPGDPRLRRFGKMAATSAVLPTSLLSSPAVLGFADASRFVSPRARSRSSAVVRPPITEESWLQTVLDR